MGALLPSSLIFDRAAIMRAAHVEARVKLAALRADGFTTWTYATVFQHAL